MTDEKKSPTTAPLYFFGRGRFLRLEEAKPFETGGKPRWEAAYILDPTDAKQAADIKKLLESAAALAKEHYGKVPLAIKKLAVKFVPGTPKLDLNDPKNEPDDIRLFCLQDGDAEKYKNYAGYAGNFIVAASNTKLAPDVVNRAGVKVKKGEPQYPYDGCNVRGSVSFWLLMGQQAAKTGRLLGCNLRGVQFVSDNEAFTQDAIDDEFEALEDLPAATGGSTTSAFD
jgi:Enterobacter phage Enc34, ssDNA-binding protein